MKNLSYVTFFLVVVAILYGAVNSNTQFFDGEYITDDGLHLRYDGIDCDIDPNIEIYLELSPVKYNEYNTCKDVNIKLGLMMGETGKGQINFVWGAVDCGVEQIRQKTIALKLNDFFTGEKVNYICENRLKYSVKLENYEYVQPKSVSLKPIPTADPLGQQARLESSIPKDGLNITAWKYDESIFVDEDWVLLIQKKLSLLGDYEGPFDGEWNNNMEKEIEKILEQNFIYFEKVKSAKSLEILGVIK